MNERVYKLKGIIKFVLHIAEYSNGIETTGGLFKPEELEEYAENIFGITYDSDHATELPVDWPDLLVLDDRDIRQKIKEIHWNRVSKKYEMEDGTFSEEVTL